MFHECTVPLASSAKICQAVYEEGLGVAADGYLLGVIDRLVSAFNNIS
jgi:hypothetical protein